MLPRLLFQRLCGVAELLLQAHGTSSRCTRTSHSFWRTTRPRRDWKGFWPCAGIFGHGPAVEALWKAARRRERRTPHCALKPWPVGRAAASSTRPAPRRPLIAFRPEQPATATPTATSRHQTPPSSHSLPRRRCPLAAALHRVLRPGSRLTALRTRGGSHPRSQHL